MVDEGQYANYESRYRGVYRNNRADRPWSKDSDELSYEQGYRPKETVQLSRKITKEGFEQLQNKYGIYKEPAVKEAVMKYIDYPVRWKGEKLQASTPNVASLIEAKMLHLQMNDVIAKADYKKRQSIVSKLPKIKTKDMRKDIGDFYKGTRRANPDYGKFVFKVRRAFSSGSDAIKIRELKARLEKAQKMKDVPKESFTESFEADTADVTGQVTLKIGGDDDYYKKGTVNLEFQDRDINPRKRENEVVRSLQASRWKWHPSRKYWSKSLLVNPQAAEFAKKLVDGFKSQRRIMLDNRQRLARAESSRAKQELMF